MSQFYEQATFKRIMSSVRNIKDNNNEKFETLFFAGDYIFLRCKNENHIVLQSEKNLQNKEIYKIIEKSPIEILSDFGYELKAKANTTKKKIDYAEVMKFEFNRLKKREEIIVSGVVSKTENEFLKYYNLCFEKNKALQKDNANLFRLGCILETFEDEAVNIIFKFKFNNEDLAPIQRKSKRSGINRNLNGVRRFMIFSKKLQRGVYQEITIPITHFVKITKDDWKKVLAEIDPHSTNLLVLEKEDSDIIEEDEEEDGE